MKKNMAYDSFNLIPAIEPWVEQAVAQGWLTLDFRDKLHDLLQYTPEGLTENDMDRPLFVAFMGGTGVGKSSLLNRLAGQSIAKTGIERPTSREVTLYCHDVIKLKNLEAYFPIQNIQISRHDNLELKRIVWLDMPDFDSVEQNNRHIVLQWIPYIDVLVYVVSPERYKDNQAWRILQAEGARHAWLFVMNQWDRADHLQFDDFQRQLESAGFNTPLLFKTSCIETLEPDELGLLQEAIQRVANNQAIDQLQNHTARYYQAQMQDYLQQCDIHLGQASSAEQLAQWHKQQWPLFCDTLYKGLAWPIQQIASTADRQVDTSELWDVWAQSRLTDYLDQLTIEAGQSGLPRMPVSNAVSDFKHNVDKEVTEQTVLHCRAALLKPGNGLQRSLLSLSQICEILCPLLAMGWVGYQVFSSYYQVTHQQGEFLGLNFAIHSTLLIALSGLIPFFIRKKLQPSMHKAALKGLHKGLEQALMQLNLQIQKRLNAVFESHSRQLNQLNQLMETLKNDHEPREIQDSTLARMLKKSDR